MNVRKPIWGEGTMILPQHLQQLERYYDSQLEHYYISNTLYGWGFQEAVLNISANKLGILTVERIEGFFKNGSYFNETFETAPNLSIAVPANIEYKYVHLIWSDYSNHQQNYELASDAASTQARYINHAIDLVDLTEITQSKQSVSVSSPNLRLVLEDDIPKNAESLPIALISSTNNSGEISLDESYIPPALNMKVALRLKNYQNEVFGMLGQRSQALANVLSNPTLMGSGDVRDFLMLQTINRYNAYMHHITTTKSSHPYHVFENWLKLYGDLSTFEHNKKSFELPIYDHDNLTLSFSKLIKLLRDALSIVLEQRAIKIPLELRDEATRVAITPDESLLNACTFVLAIQSSMQPEQLRNRLPTTIKIGSVEKINELVSYHLPGIKVQALSTAPRELPYHSGFSYFELDKTSELWGDLTNSSALAIHLAGKFPELQMEFWAIKPL